MAKTVEHTRSLWTAPETSGERDFSLCFSYSYTFHPPAFKLITSAVSIGPSVCPINISAISTRPSVCPINVSAISIGPSESPVDVAFRSERPIK